MIERGDCAGWNKWLEWDNNLQITWMYWEWKHEFSEISWALRIRIERGEQLWEAPTWDSIWNEERIWSTNLELNPSEKKRMKNNKLEAREHLREGSPDQNTDWKGWSDFTWINGYMIKIYESLQKKMVGGRENKDNLGRWNGHRWKNLELILRMLRWSDPLEEKHAG